MTTPGASRHRLWRFHARTSVEPENPVLFIEGRLGHKAAVELESVIAQHPAAASVIIDLSGVDYLSSAALKVLKAHADDQSKKGGRLILRAPSVAARLALELSGLLELVDV